MSLCPMRMLSLMRLLLKPFSRDSSCSTRAADRRSTVLTQALRPPSGLNPYLKQLRSHPLPTKTYFNRLQTLALYLLRHMEILQICHVI